MGAGATLRRESALCWQHDVRNVPSDAPPTSRTHRPATDTGLHTLTQLRGHAHDPTEPDKEPHPKHVAAIFCTHISLQDN